MIVNRSNLTNVFINLKTTFNKAFDAAPALWQQTTMLITSGSGQNDYSWLSRFPKMRKWKWKPRKLPVTFPMVTNRIRRHFDR